MSSESVQPGFNLGPALLSRDMLWSQAINDGLMAELVLRHETNPRPRQRRVAATAILCGQLAQIAMYEAYQELPQAVETNLVTNAKFPVSAIDEDSRSAAVIGLFEAMRLWEPTSKYNFRAFANIQIRKALIDNYADRSEANGLPRIHQNRRAELVAREDTDMPEAETLFHDWGLDGQKEVHVLQAGEEPGYTEIYTSDDYLKLLHSLQSTGRVALSGEPNTAIILNKIQGRGFVCGERLLTPSEMEKRLPGDIEKYERQQVISRILEEVLDDQERFIITARFGFKDGVIQSVDEVAQTCTITPQEVRKIEGRALDKLRTPHISNKLVDFH